MIDTIKLCLSDYEVSKNNKLTIQPSSYNCLDGSKNCDYPLVYYNDSSLVEYGSKAFYNSDTFNLSITPKQNVIFYHVQMSVPKVHNGNNYYSVGKDGTTAVLKKVEKELKEVGIKTNIHKSKISRLDTFKNIVTEESFQDYFEVFNSLNIPRKQKVDYGTTFLFNNKQEEFCIYDKILEMKSKGLNYSVYPENTMRFENRLLKPRKIRDTLNLSLLEELINNYDSVKEHFKNTFEKNLFKFDSSELKIITVNQMSLELEYFYDSYKQAISQYLKFKGFEYIILHSGKESFIEAIKTTLKKKNLKDDAIRQQLHRLQKELKECEMNLLHMKKLPNKDKTLLSLYNELKTKVLS